MPVTLCAHGHIRAWAQAFDAWRAARYGSVAKQQILRRALARIQRGVLSRAFQAWKDKFHIVDANLAMRRKVGGTGRGGAGRYRAVQDGIAPDQLLNRTAHEQAQRRSLRRYGALFREVSSTGRFV